MGARDLKSLVPLLAKYGMQADLQPPPPDADLKARAVPGSTASDEARAHMIDVVQRFVRAWTYKDMPWLEAQEAGLLWAPIRKPHENALDEHWLQRKSFADVYHPEHGRSFRYPTSKWLTTKTSWQVGRRAPLLGEDTETVLAEPRRRPPSRRSQKATPTRRSPRCTASRSRCRASRSSTSPGSSPPPAAPASSPRWAPKATRWSGRTIPTPASPPWPRSAAARRAMPRPARCPGVKDPDMGGQFNNKNAGKRGISLNIRHPKGLAIAKDLVRICDIVAEGFSPGVLQRLGLGYDVMKKIRPDIIYIQQAGMGAHGTYGRMRTVGPVAAAFGGQADMSGLPEPAMPVGWGYSYLDWMGAYGYALALLGALYHRDRTGEGQWIDASQCESGLVPDRHIDPRLVGERPRMAPLRQSLALQAGRPAWRVSAARATIAGSPSPASPKRSGTPWPASPVTPSGWTTPASPPWPTAWPTRTRWTRRSAPGPRPGRPRTS